MLELLCLQLELTKPLPETLAMGKVHTLCLEADLLDRRELSENKKQVAEARYMMVQKHN